MHKKIMLACMAIAAFAAFVVAPMASAAVLTENGVAVEVGKSIKGTAGQTRFVAGENTVTCSSATMSGTVTANSGGTVAGTIPAGNPVFTGTASEGDCTGGLLGAVKPSVNSELCLHIPKGTDTGSVTGCEGKAVTFTLFATNIFLVGPTKCLYEKASIAAEITTAPANAAIKVVKGEKAKGESTNPSVCPAEGELEMEFELTTTDGTVLTFS
jgi:hypothetical protein